MGMDKVRLIEVDEDTADELERCASSRGVSVSQVISEMIPAAIDSDVIADLDRQWAAIKAGEPTIPHEEVAKWLKTWGTPDFKPWSEREG